MDKTNTVLLIFLLILAVVLAYANSLNVGFVYDDYAFVYNNEAIRTFSPLSKFLLSAEAFSQPVSYHVYRPLASLTFAVNYALNGLGTFGYHVVNLAFHILNVILVFLLLRQVGFQVAPSFAGALIFAIHPVHTEAVTWISGRGNVLYLFFFLIAFLLYIRADRGSGYPRFFLLAAAIAAYGMSLLSKEMAVPLPALLVGYDFYFHRDWTAKRRLRRLWLYAPFVLVAAAYILLRALVLGRVGQVSYHGGSAYMTFLVMLRAAVIYIGLLFAPVGLSLSRHFQPVHSLFDLSVFPSFCLIILAIAAGIVSFRRAIYFSFALFWFAVAMLPVSNIIPLNALVADRFLYGPSIGFSILIAAWTSGMLKFKGSRRSLAVAGLALIAFCFMLLSIGRNNDWKNTFLLWSKTARSSPTSYVAYNNLGFEYMKLGRIPEAVEALRKALELKEDLPETHINLARCYSKLGRINEAIVHYNAGLTHLEGHPEANEASYELGMLLERKGRIEGAIACYEAAVRGNSRLLDAHRRLAELYRVRDFARSVEHYSAVLSLDPADSDAYNKLALLYYDHGDLASAADVLKRALSLNPEDKAARRLLDQIE